MRINFPANCKIVGANLTTSVALGTGTTPWITMWQNFDTLWPTCIKPQIDLMAGNGIGCNTFRLLGGSWGVLNGVYTQAYYDARQYIVANYLKSLGCYYYPNFGSLDIGSTNGGETNYSATTAQVSASAASTINTIWPLGNVIGMDLFQEAAPGGFSNGLIALHLAAIKAYGGACAAIPLTCSSSTGFGGYPLTSGAGQAWMNAIGGTFDFIDFHIYESTPQPLNLLDHIRGLFPTQEIMIGEFGLPQQFSVDVGCSVYKACLDICTQPDPMVRGGLAWCVTDDHDPTVGTPLGNNSYGFHTSGFIPRREALNVLRGYTGGSLASALAGHR